ncbi:serine/threonine-protein kinase PBL35-like [Rhododendron vialii]|uniref:serine/threonine-protein kinase PBL35-like n=1 Tax=Rhododendron vialii TaxID=182163 RepID=UPI00265F95AF|nr:serine/threonine-protein kinase PBL35-like [Rhododendron vialii]
MSSLDSQNFEEGQVSQPVCLATNVTSGTDLSNGNSLSRNETKVSDVLPSSDPALPGASSYRLPISKSQNRIVGGVIQSEGSCRRFTLDEVQVATNIFDDALVIGIGGFGKVYKGFISNGASTTVVAIKRLNAESNQGAEEFWTEVKLLSKFHHFNLVSLIGYCNENHEMILVYEYIALGNLANHLYKSSRKESSKSISHLTWAQRLNICFGAARGLDYLHTGTEQRIIHRDVKTTNILLDENLVAKISDFGICKLITSQATTHVSTKVKATRGYWDPEYFITGQVTRKSDVYAFGVVLLEVLCGRPPLDDRLEEEQISLINWAKMYIEKGKLDRIIDPSLNGETTPHSLKYFAKLANNCLNTEPKKRPTMSEVAKSLEIALVLHERKGRSQGSIAKAFQGIKLVPMGMGMNRWLRAGESNGLNNGGVPILDVLTQSVYHRFSLPEIQAATNDFNDGLLIGRYSWFRSYKGCMAGGTRAVMIKRYEAREAHSARLVSAEIGVQSLPRHANIVSLMGFCKEKHELILVYDYMVNGTLESRLHETHNDPLHWKKRLEICIGIAQGLQYLHTNKEQQFVHRDITSSNVFLDNEWVAKIAAFEMSLPIHNSKATKGVETAVCGTYAYLDPEYLRTSKVTKKTDVFAFGIVLLEVLCAKTPFSSNQNKNELWWNEIWLVDWFRVCVGIGTIDEVIDPYLIGKIAPECFRHYVNLALSCLPYEGIRRPSMKDVLDSLQCSLKMQEAWENSIEMGDELHMADGPRSYNDIISGESEFIIGRQKYLISDLVPPWSAISSSGY